MTADSTKGEGRSPASSPARARQRGSLRSSKIAQLVANEIVADIVAQGLKEGDRLPTESTMLEEFDVGRASIREALRILEIYGLIRIRQGHKGGPVVADLEPSDLGRTLSLYFQITGGTYGDLVEARMIFEPVMARLAAEAQDPEDMKRLEGVMKRDAEGSLEDPEYIELADEFHYAICGMSGNRIMDMLGRSLRTLYIGRISGRGVFPPEGRAKSKHLHTDIGEAVLDGKPDLAERLMKSHMLELAEMQRKSTPDVLEERVSWQASSGGP
jgi:GntR family transcriptional repressor for pyruvate dehydrogenase complex